MTHDITKDQLTIVLEGIRTDFKVFSEKLNSLMGLDKKFDLLQATVNRHSEDLLIIKTTVKQHSVTLQEHSQGLKVIRTTLQQHGNDLTQIKSHLGVSSFAPAMTSYGSQKSDRLTVLENRVTKLEDKP